MILLRGAGHPGRFPANEHRPHRAMAAIHHLGPDPDPARLDAIAAGWRPFRRWTALLLRSWLSDVAPEITEGRRAATLPGRIDPAGPL